MSTVNDSDLFVIERSGTQYQVRSDEMSELNDTDLFVVERAGVQYKLEAQDLNLGPTGAIEAPVEVLTPVNGSGLNAGNPYNPLSSAITGVAGAGDLTFESDEITDVSVLTGTNWSQYLTSNTTMTDPEFAFNGNLNQRAFSTTVGAGQDHIITWDGGGASFFPACTTFEIHGNLGGFDVGKIVIYFEGGGSQEHDSSSVTGYSWHTMTVNQPTSRIRKMQLVKRNNSSSTSTLLGAIRCDGTILLNTPDQTQLTVSSTTNLSSFTAGGSVSQDSGYTPETSAITVVTPGPTWSSQLTNVERQGHHFGDPYYISQSASAVISGGGLGTDGTSAGLLFTNNGPVTCYVPEGGVTLHGTNQNDANGSGFECRIRFANGDEAVVTRANSVPAKSKYTITGIGADRVGDQFQWLRMSNGNDQRALTYTVSFSPDGSNPTQLNNGAPTILELTDNTDLEYFNAGDTLSNGATVISSDPSNSELLVSGGTWNVGDTVTGPTLAAATGTVDSTSGSELTLAASDGYWIPNAGKKVTTSTAYDVALTFTDDTELANIIGPATQANSDGSDVDSAETSAITNVSASSTPGVTLQEPDNAVSGDWATIVGAPLNNGRTPFLFPDGGGGIRGFVHFVGMTPGDKISMFLESPGGGGARGCTGDIQETSVEIPSSGSPALIEVTVTQASGSFAIDFNGSAGHPCYAIQPGPGSAETVLTLTDDTDLDKFEVGDVAKSESYSTRATVTAGSAFNDDRGYVSNIWDGVVTGSGTNGGDFTHFLQPNDSAGLPYELTFNPPLVARSGTIKAYVSGYSTTSFPYNANSGINSGTWTVSTIPSEQDTSTTTLTTFKVDAANGSGANVQIWGFGDDLGVFTDYTARITNIDESSNTITVDVGGLAVGETISKTLNTATIGTVVSVDGTTLYGSSVTGDGFYVGKYLAGAEVTREAPSPSEIVFTSMNGGTTTFTGTNATLSSRLWTLESGSSASGPWTLLASIGDTAVAASQDGATPWSSAPTLPANTFYRVKVEYQSDNALPVESVYNTFRTGDA